MSLHTFAVIAFGLMCANEARGLFEKQEWTVGKIVIGIPCAAAVWSLLIWLVFYA